MEGLKCIRLEADAGQIRRCKERVAALDEPVQETAGILSLAGNAVRLKIILLLSEESRLCPCDLSDILGMSIPAVSQHLRKLKDRKVVLTDKQGPTIYYSLNPRNQALLDPVLDQLKQDQALPET